MTIEYNQSDDHLNNFPNPFVIENIFLFIAAATLLGGGIFTLLEARAFFLLKQTGLASAVVAVAVGLLAAGCKSLFACMSQLRFFLGRQYPLGLCPELIQGQMGGTAESVNLADTIRSRVIQFPEPNGPLNGLLYSLNRKLIAAPPPLQAAVSQHFRTLFSVIGLLASMAVSYFLFVGTRHEGLVSWVYLPMSGLSLLAPLVPEPSLDKVSSGNKTVIGLVALVVFTAVGPMLMQHLPTWSLVPMWVAPCLVLSASLVSAVLFLFSALSQMDIPEQTGVSCEQTTISMNCHPSQLWPLLSRDFQDNWVRNIPNRIYANIPPMSTEEEEPGSSKRGADTERGHFRGVIMEETQPTVTSNMGFSSIREALSMKHVRWLIVLCLWGCVLAIGASLTAIYFVPQFSGMARMEISRSILVMLAFVVALELAFRNGHLIWSRMYFRSRITFIELDGTFQSAKIQVGNQFRDRLQTSATQTRVEDAAMRVWMLDAESVAFGKNARRFMTGMAPVDRAAHSMAERMKSFAFEQSTIATPTSQKDASKIEAIDRINRSLAKGVGVGQLNGARPKQVVHSNDALMPEPIHSGRIKFFNSDKGFGYVIAADGRELHVNHQRISGNGYVPQKGDLVTFVPKRSQRGWQAHELKLAD